MAKKEKFEFGIDFQKLILQLTVTDRVEGLKIIKYYEDSYFTLLSHATIAYLIKSFYKKKRRIPSESVLRENLRLYYRTREAANFTDQDKTEISNVIQEIYSQPVPDGDVIVEKCISFARYISFKSELENIDITKYDSYAAYADKLKKAQNIGEEAIENYGTFLVGGMHDRAYNRELMQSWPTPYWQLNRLLNSKGLGRANLIMLMSQQKRFKTGSLINIGLAYMKRRKKVLYIDLENGEQAITTRSEQSVGNVDQEDILSSVIDKKLMKVFRRYKRIGAEMIIKRMPAYKTTADDIGNLIDIYKVRFGLVIDILIVDYGDLLGAVSKVVDDTKRISDAYVDLKNLGVEKDLEAIYTASHVTTEAHKRTATRYVAGDVAKCRDKVSHVDMAIGVQESEIEMENGVMRWEIIEQRNGSRMGKVLFWVDIKKQRMVEFTKSEVDDYYEQLGHKNPDDDEKNIKPKKTKRKSDL